jgi:hypothetical protein
MKKKKNNKTDNQFFVYSFLPGRAAPSRNGSVMATKGEVEVKHEWSYSLFMQKLMHKRMKHPHPSTLHYNYLLGLLIQK